MDIQDSNTDEDMTAKYELVITIERVIIYIFGVLLMAMSFYNIYFYLCKAGKYKVIANTLLYVIAEIAIILAMF